MNLFLNRFYIVAMIVGAVVPWWFFGTWIGQNGLDVAGFIADISANGATSGFSADLLITSAVLWVWSFIDGRQVGVSHWWIMIPATLFVGLSLAFPLYLYLRSNAQMRSEAEAVSLGD